VHGDANYVATFHCAVPGVIYQCWFDGFGPAPIPSVSVKAGDVVEFIATPHMKQITLVMRRPDNSNYMMTVSVVKKSP
jgi:hypothetical protein